MSTRRRAIIGNNARTSEPFWSCHVLWLGSEDPDDVAFQHTNTMPEFATVTQDGTQFLKIPTMYRKIIGVGEYGGVPQITGFVISDKQVDNDYHPYSVFVKEDGVTVMPYVLLGIDTTTVVGYGGDTTMSEARERARSYGTGYQQYDWQFQKLYQDLVICKANAVDIRSSLVETGVNDRLRDPLGILHYGEVLIDGIAYQTRAVRFSYKPTKYTYSVASSADYITASYSFPSSSGKVRALGYDENNEFVNVPSAITNTTDTYYCSYCGVWNNTRPIFARHPMPDGTNIFTYEADGEWTTKRSMRLCYRPI